MPMRRDETSRNQLDVSVPGSPRFSAGELAAVFSAIRTERLALRRPRAEDGPAMFRVHGDPATNRYNPAGPDPDLATSERTLELWREQWEQNGYGYWVVTPAGLEEVCGFAGVRHIVWRNRDVLNLYYRFVPAVWGRGYATEAAREAVRLAGTYLSHLPVIARVRAENLPSIHTAERAGLQRHPELDTAEHMVYALGWRSSGQDGDKNAVC